MLPSHYPDFFSKKLYIDVVDSSNMELIRFLEKGLVEELFMIQTGFQTGGKGQGSALWESQKNKNLLFSFVIKPTFLKISEQFYISIMVSLALRDVVAKYIGNETELKIKWPNDIYVNDGKIAGILIENAIQGQQFEWVVGGVGLNVNQTKFQSDAPNPISLFDCIGKTIDLQEVLNEFEKAFEERYYQLENKEFENMKKEYLASMYQIGELRNYRAKGEEFQGKIIGVDQYGFLSIESHEGIRSFDVKEVTYL